MYGARIEWGKMKTKAKINKCFSFQYSAIDMALALFIVCIIEKGNKQTKT